MGIPVRILARNTVVLLCAAGLSSAALGVCLPLPPGLDQFPSTGKVVIDLSPLTGGGPEVVRLSSAGLLPTIVQRQAQFGTTIPIEMVQLELTGNGILAGSVRVLEHPVKLSTGQIENVEQDILTCAFTGGDSFFDIFVRIELPDLGGQVLENFIPLRVQSHIDRLPPKDERYENPFLNPIPLYDPANPPPAGPILGYVLYEVHEADPELPPGRIDCFDTTLQSLVTIFPPYFPGGYNNFVFASGPTQVRRTNPFDTLPLNPNAGDTIQTEILAMNLTGSDPQLGNLRIDTNHPFPSLGQAVENTGPPTYPVDSFFDVFVTIDTSTIGRLQTIPPGSTHVEASNALANPLRTMPPGVRSKYKEPAAPPVPLWNDPPTVIVGQIQQVSHTIGEYQSWEPPPPAGDDCFDSWLTLQLTIYDPYFPGGCVETLMLPGDTRVLRAGPFNPGDGRDQINTLMAKIALSSPSLCAGLLNVRLSPTIPSYGQIRSIAPAENDPYDSFFDIFMEMDTGIGPLHTNSPSHMTTTINNVPPDPGEIYYGPGTVIPLFDQFNVQIGEILEVEHIVHTSVVCPLRCRPMVFVTPGGFVNGGIPEGGAGVLYDIVRFDLQTLPASFATAVCLQDNGPGTILDPLIPAPGGGFGYLSRDGFDDFTGTYNDGTEVSNRDPQIIVCP